MNNILEKYEKTIYDTFRHSYKSIYNIKTVESLITYIVPDGINPKLTKITKYTKTDTEIIKEEITNTRNDIIPFHQMSKYKNSDIIFRLAFLWESKAKNINFHNDFHFEPHIITKIKKECYTALQKFIGWEDWLKELSLACKNLEFFIPGSDKSTCLITELGYIRLDKLKKRADLDSIMENLSSEQGNRIGVFITSVRNYIAHPNEYCEKIHENLIIHDIDLFELWLLDIFCDKAICYWRNITFS